MSLSRLALRLAAYEALNPYATLVEGPWPTIAGANVFDSRIDAFAEEDEYAAFLAKIEGKPIIVLYTEEQETDAPPGTEYPPQWEMVELVAEILIATQAEMTVAGASGEPESIGSVEAALTDRQREALLDTLEAQVRRLLDSRGYDPSGALFRKTLIEVRHIKSVPDRTPDRTFPQARRAVRFRIRARQDTWPPVPVSPAPTGLGLLPYPLRMVAEALDANSTGGKLVAALAVMIAPPSAPLPLEGIAISAQLDRANDPPIAAAAVSAETAPADVKAAVGVIDGNI